MDVFLHAASQMAILFILLIVGMVARRLRLMNDRFDTMLSQLVMKVALPAMILSSVLTNENLPDAQTIWLLIGCSVVAYTIIILIAELVPRLYRGKSPASKGTHSFIIAFGNVGFIGFPVLSAIFGPSAVFYGAVYNIPYNIALFSIGEAMIKRQDSADRSHVGMRERAKAIARTLANPCMAACVLSIVLALAKVTDVGGIIGTSCSYLGQLTVPASMLIIGSSLAAIGGVLIANHVGQVNFFIGFIAGIKAFTAAVLGGIGSIPGAMVGGLVLGLCESFATGYISSAYEDALAFALLVLILIFRPAGILGKPKVQKV